MVELLEAEKWKYYKIILPNFIMLDLINTVYRTHLREIGYQDSAVSKLKCLDIDSLFNISAIEVTGLAGQV